MIALLQLLKKHGWKEGTGLGIVEQVSEPSILLYWRYECNAIFPSPIQAIGAYMLLLLDCNLIR